MGQTPDQGHRVNNNGTHGKVLSQGIFMWNIKVLPLTVQKIFTALFTRLFLNDRGRVVKNGKQSNPVAIFFKQCMCKKVDITIMWWPNNDGAMMQQQWCDRKSLHPHRTLASCHCTSHRTDVPSRHRHHTTASWLHRPKHDGAIINYMALSRFHTI